MATLQALLTDPAAAGVYRLAAGHSLSALRQEIAQSDARLFTINGAVITDKPSFLHASARALHFPRYFGRNWDAFADCLRDLAWAPAPAYVVLYHDVAPFARQAPADWAVALDIFGAAARFWRDAGAPFAVLLTGADKIPQAVPLLDDGSQV
ncbi:MAG: barstar family protein [Thermomicrobiales bacterium]